MRRLLFCILLVASTAHGQIKVAKSSATDILSKVYAPGTKTLLAEIGENVNGKDTMFVITFLGLHTYGYGTDFHSFWFVGRKNMRDFLMLLSKTQSDKNYKETLMVTAGAGHTVRIFWIDKQLLLELDPDGPGVNMMKCGKSAISKLSVV